MRNGDAIRIFILSLGVICILAVISAAMMIELAKDSDNVTCDWFQCSFTKTTMNTTRSITCSMNGEPIDCNKIYILNNTGR